MKGGEVFNGTPTRKGLPQSSHHSPLQLSHFFPFLTSHNPTAKDDHIACNKPTDWHPTTDTDG